MPSRPRGSSGLLLHLGGKSAVRRADVEALLDFHLFVRVPTNRDFLSLARRTGRLLTPSTRPPETVVITTRGLLLSPIGRVTLARRLSRPTGAVRPGPLAAARMKRHGQGGGRKDGPT